MNSARNATTHRVLLVSALLAATFVGEAARAQTDATPYLPRAYDAAHPDLPRSAGRGAQLANEDYVRALARVVYYWAYPAIDVTSRTSQWEIMKAGPGLLFGIGPGSPMNTSACIADYLPPTQRIVVTPNNDTFYGAAFLNLGAEPVVVQTPTDVPPGHYWTMQIADVFTNVIHTIGSGPKSQMGKYLLVGPDWQGQKPDGFVDVLRLTTNYGGVFPRSFAARTPEAKKRAIAVLDQMAVYPFSQNQAGARKIDCEAVSRNKVFPAGVTPEMVAADPDLLRPQWVVPERFWEDVETMLENNPTVSKDDTAMAEQARTLVALRKSSPAWKAILDEAALQADVSLHTSGKYEQVGVDAGNGWQRQNNGGLWGSDWFGRAQAAVVYVLVNDYHEAIYFIRGTDAKGALLDGKHRYVMNFPKDTLPPVDRSRGGFWSLTMYDKDYFMLPKPANGRTNVGTVSLDADQLKFASDGSLTITMSHAEPADIEAKANWLPAPDGQFALIVRAYVPTQPILDGAYKLPNVERR
ncbi:MAG: DUF1254 domain-containing protein [Rhizobiaceae bacterium]